MKYDQKGIKGTEQNVAARGNGQAASDARLTFASDPDGAEIEIDGVYVGTTPRERTVVPGDYSIVIRKKGFERWVRTISVQSGEALTVSAELEPQ